MCAHVCEHFYFKCTQSMHTHARPSHTHTHTRIPVSHSGLFARSVCGTSQKFPVKFPFISCRKRLLFSFAEPPSQTDRGRDRERERVGRRAGDRDRKTEEVKRKGEIVDSVKGRLGSTRLHCAHKYVLCLLSLSLSLSICMYYLH